MRGLFTAICFLPLACGGGEQHAETAEEAGPVRLRLVEDLRLDADAEDFSLIGRVVVRVDGTMAVPLPQDMQIRLYDAGGTRIATVGGRGGGPGEFQHLGAMTWIGDTLIVDDQRQRRVTYVDAAGDVLRTVPLPPPLVPKALSAESTDTTFRFFIAQSGTTGGELLGLAAVDVGTDPRATQMPRRILALSPDGSARVIAEPPSYVDERWSMTIGGLSNYIPLAMRPQIVFASDGSRFAFLTADQSAPQGSWAVTVIEADGDTVFARTQPFTGEPIPAAVADSAIAAMAPGPGQPRESGSDPSRFQAAARERMPIVYAPIERVVPALDGTTWLTMRASADGEGVLVLDARGQTVATATLPPRSRIHDASATHVWMTEVGAFDLVSVVRYRIER
jgi:hypothetical protein